MADLQDVKSYDANTSPKYAGEDEEPQLNVGGHGGTQRHLRNYQVTMIGFCSGIGTGLFIGSGAAYAKAGPAGLLLAYSIVGIVLWCVMQSIAELATLVRPRIKSHLSRRVLIGKRYSCQQQVLFPIGPLDSLTRQSDSHLPFLTVTAIPLPLHLKSRPPR